MLLDRKRLLVTGVLNDASIAFSVAKLAQEQGAEVVLTSFGRALSLTRRAAKRLPSPPEVLELDVTDPSQLAGLADTIGGRLDGVLHAIAYAPESCLGGGFLDAPWADVSLAMQVSAFSLQALAVAALPLFGDRGGSIVGLDFDNSRQAWPVYDWMGVAKAALEATARYLARDLGPQRIRVNLVAAGPVRTIAAKSIPGFERFETVWTERAPLGWDVRDAEPVARACVALFSDWFPATTGEIVHVDGGFHAVGA
jgi:meromycolic acid enoyl-[acyl-carrier-protein] reductase